MSSQVAEFYDPSKKPYGILSNTAPVSVELRGLMFPTVQHAVYGTMLGTSVLSPVRSPYDLYHNYTTMMSNKYLEDMRSAVEEAYIARLTAEKILIESNKRFLFYRPTTAFKSSLLLGVDAYECGWNIVGQVLTGIYHKRRDNMMAIHRASIAATLLHLLIRKGNNLSQFVGKLPVEILEYLGMDMDMIDSLDNDRRAVYKQFQDGTLSHYRYVLLEQEYPGSLARMILKDQAPYINATITGMIQDALLEHAAGKILSSTFSVPKDEQPDALLQQIRRIDADRLASLKERLMTLYHTNRLEVTTALIERIDGYRSGYISDADVALCAHYLPRNPLPDLLNEKPDSYVLDITDGHALSPAHECVFEMDGLTFYTVIHAVCYRMFSAYLDKKEAYNLLLEHPKKKPTKGDFYPAATTNFDDMYQRIVTNHTIDLLREALLFKVTKNPSITHLLFESEKKGITGFVCKDPYDPILGVVPRLQHIMGNAMNQTGQILLQLRSSLSPSLRLEYQFMDSLVGANEFMHMWLKKRVLILHLALHWYSQILTSEEPMTMKQLVIFFSRIFTPYHTIYRSERPAPEPVDPFFRDFFAGFRFSEDCLQYVYDHYVAMVRAILDSNDKSIEKTIQAINTEDAFTKPDDATITKKLMYTLKYLPRRYTRGTLSGFASLVLGVSVAVVIPNRTHFVINTDYYTYMTPAIKSVLDGLTLTDKAMGDVAFVVSHIRNNISPERYQFFFL